MKTKLTQPLSVKEIERITDAFCDPSIDPDATVRYIATHSDEVEKETLFLALAGEHTHGERFREEVIKQGGLLLTEKKGEKSLTVTSVTEALYALARAHLSELSQLKHTVCITGSVGKTTTKEILKKILPYRFKTHATEGNQNSDIGLPLTVLQAPTDTEALLLEAGMNHAGELARISLLVRPSHAIITSIGHAHIGNFGSRYAIAAAKKEILLSARKNACILIPAGEPLLSDIQGAKTVSHTGLFADYTLRTPERSDSQMYFQYGTKEIPFPCEMKDTGMRAAAFFATAVALELGISESYIEDEIFKLSDNIIRQKTYFTNEMEIVFDAYNASLESVLSAIEGADKKQGTSFALVLGDMRELGEHTHALHCAVGSACAKKKEKINLLFLFGENAPTIAAEAIADGFCAEHIFVNPDENRPQITAWDILRNTKRGSRILLKGAHGLHMERILNILIKNTGGDGDAG